MVYSYCDPDGKRKRCECKPKCECERCEQREVCFGQFCSFALCGKFWYQYCWLCD